MKSLTTLTLTTALSTGLFGITACSSGNETQAVVPVGEFQLDEITPTHGTANGETIALLRGSGFVPGMTVKFGQAESRQVTFINDSMMTALVPTHPPGTVKVSLGAAGSSNVSILNEAFSFFEQVPDDGTDTDGDGLTDVAEQIVGYPIKVDLLGLGLNSEHLIEYTVNSSPIDPDTDDDGLNDAEEFFARTNPRDHDTDGDGLWDLEEAKRWLTSPISVDSDGDARDADPSSKLSTIP